MPTLAIQTNTPATPWDHALATTSPETTRAKVREIHDEGIATNSKLALQSDLRYFWAWVRVAYRIEQEAYPVPAEVVERFVADHVAGLDYATDYALRRSGHKAKPGPHAMNTIRRRVSSISTAHNALGLPGELNPCTDFRVRKLLQSSAKVRSKSGEKVGKKRALTLELLAQLIETCHAGTLADLRDRAILSFGFATGGRRREEIAGANWHDLEPVPEGFIFLMGRSKTDQKGQGVSLPVFGMAGEYLLEWLAASGVRQGALFRRIDRHDNILGRLAPAGIAEIIQRRCLSAGLPPDEFGGHSLRSGFLTSGGRAGIALADLMALSTHRSVQVASGYYQVGALTHSKAAWVFDNMSVDQK